MISDEEFYSWIKNPSKWIKVRAEDLAALLIYSQFTDDFKIAQSPAIHHNIDSVWKQFADELFTDRLIGLRKMKEN